MPIWINNSNKVLVSSSGKVIICDHCPCFTSCECESGSTLPDEDCCFPTTLYLHHPEGTEQMTWCDYIPSIDSPGWNACVRFCENDWIVSIKCSTEFGPSATLYLFSISDNMFTGIGSFPIIPEICDATLFEISFSNIGTNGRCPSFTVSFIANETP